MNFINIKKINYVFNDNIHNVILIANNIGFIIYTIQPFKKKKEIILNKIIDKIKNKELTNIFFFTNKENLNLLNIFDLEQNKIINIIKFKNHIKNFYITKNFIIIIFDDFISIFEINFNFIKKIFYNKKVFCINYLQNLFIYIDINNNINLFDINNNTTQIISDFSNINIDILNLSLDNNFIVFTDANGIDIYIYNLKLKKIHKILKRGTQKNKILQFNFSKNNEFLLCNTEKKTLHIFDIKNINILNIVLSEYSLYRIYFKNELYSFFFNDKIIIINENYYNLNLKLEINETYKIY